MSGVTFTWNFGNGDTGSEPVVAYVYPAVVTASNSINVSSTTTAVTITERSA